MIEESYRYSVDLIEKIMKRDDTRQLIKEYAEYWQISDEEVELIVEGWAKEAIHDAMIKEISD